MMKIKLLLTNIQISKLRKVFANNYAAQKLKFSIKDFFSKCDQISGKPRIWSLLLKKSLMENFIFVQFSSAYVKLSKTQLHEIEQSGGLLGRFLRPLLKTGLPLIGNVLKLLTKCILIPLWLTAAASAADAGIHKKMFESGFTTLMNSNEETNNIMKIVQSLEDSGLLIKGLSQTIKNKAKQQKGGFLSILLGTLGASLLGTLLTYKRAKATSQGSKANMPRWGTVRVGEGTITAGKGLIRASQGFSCCFIL